MSHGITAALEAPTMPKKHARKKELTGLKETFGVRHHDAIAILDDPRRDELRQVLAENQDLTTYAAAAEILELPEDMPAAPCDCELCTAPLDEPREYSCENCGFFGTGFHCCECGADHEYHCDC
ncbi:hypothetical protein RB628_35180 [Streptomyces sp. ADMS]|uniref:hypothetical protein n=1 Tax=Streptomyces sp. ADMS TaxID=3071415 RepID=UPI00296F36C3|nr:hypothetical protein [Streptomyces sp. ADMS]MDW4910433.1 hypothetical protein [Streptomyces sp. ADMS]